jgi:alanyl-tRNA synthetase
LTDIDKLKEELIRQEKEAAKELLKTAVSLGSSLELSSDKEFQVFAVPELRGDAKALGACIDGLSTREQGGFCLVSASSSVLAVVAVVPKELSGEVSAKAWVDAVLAAVNGRGGGNPLKAQGQSQETDKLNEAVSIATNFVSSK